MTAANTGWATQAGPDGTAAVLRIDDVTLRFGGVTSLAGVSLHLDEGEILAVIGPNGAGKTSLFNCLTGVYTPQQGSITFRGSVRGRPDRLNNIIGRKPHRIAALGIARTFQNIRLFAALTALENVKVGVESRQRTGPIAAMLGMPWARREERDSDAAASELLTFVGLRERVNDVASALSYGEQRRLEIARALGTRPRVLLLDEPAAGTNPSEKRELESLIRRINERDVSVLLIEHDMRLVMSVATRVVVLNFGEVIASGRPDQVQGDPAVIEAYLGTPGEASKTSPEGSADAAAGTA